MKRLIYAGLLCGMVSLSSCNDFLDREPLDAITPDNFLLTESDLASYTINMYPFSTHSGWGMGGIWVNDNNTDNMVSTGYSTYWTPGQWRTDESSNWDFTTIRQCNYFLNIVQPRYDNGELTGSSSGHYLGEMYFLRAYNYFSKLQSIGDYPIITETLENDNAVLVAASKRAPRNQVARFILEDLDRAIALLTDDPDGGKNRITQMAAYLFKSRVALFEASWETYHRNTAYVPGGPGWPGDPADLGADFNLDNEIAFFLTECKAAAKHVADAVPLAVNTAADVDLWDNSAGDAQYKSNNPYFAQFYADDMGSYPEILLWRQYSFEDNIVHSSVYGLWSGANSGYNRGYVETFLFRDGLPIYAHPEYDDSSIKNVRKNRDSRLQLFMMTPGEMVGYHETTGDEVFLQTPLNLLNAERRATTGYMLRKGLGDKWYRDGNYGTEPCPVFRATEAYLNYIEASCIENGGNSIDATADGYWKQLRKRAGLPEDYMITVNATVFPSSIQQAVAYSDAPQQFETDWAVYSAGETVSKLLYNVRRERRCELIEEGLRMMDLKRWRALDQLDYTNFPDEGYRVSGMNLWESEELADFAAGDLKAEGEEGVTAPNVSGPTNSGKYLCPYRSNPSHYLYNRGYKWCEAHYLAPIGAKHFRQTASDLENVAETSVIYQNPGWPTESSQGPIGVPAEN